MLQITLIQKVIFLFTSYSRRGLIDVEQNIPLWQHVVCVHDTVY